MNTVAEAESTQLPPRPVLRSTGPPRDSEADASAAAYRHVTLGPTTPVATVAGSSDHKATRNSGQPRRTPLDPEIAESVRRAKLRTRKSWRWLAKRLGVSHPHLLQISQGDRCPSRSVAEAMRSLPFEEGEWEALYEAAVVGRGRDRRRQ